MHPNDTAAPEPARPTRRSLRAAARRTAAPAALLVAIALSSTACTTSTTPPAAAAPETTPAADPPLSAAPDAPLLCGQASAFEGIRYRSEWEHGEGLIDDAGYESRVAALHDAWTLLVAGDTDVTPAVKYVQRVVSDGGLDSPAGEFQTAMAELAEACDAAGSTISISALPGQGG